MNATEAKEMQAAFGRLTEEERAVATALSQFTEARPEAVAPLAGVLLRIATALEKIAKFGETL